MQIAADHFKENARHALADPQLQRALRNVGDNFTGKRAKAVAALPEFERLRAEARAIKDHTLDHLDLYLEAYEARVTAQGGHVHFAETAADARKIVLDICRRVGAKTVTKGKSMISEEIGLNEHLAENGIAPIETDLGEYIIQLRGEVPSHIIAPAVHVNKDQVEADFRRVHTHLPPDRDLSEPASLLAEARGVLRDRFLAADVGITGANFLVAETGTSIIVTNEGNGDLTQILPRIHIVVASLEKMVPTLNDAATILRLLARSATGQDMSVYTTLSTGPRRPDDPDGPEEYHVVILDNGRTAVLGTGIPGDAPLHPLRRLHEPLPSLQCRRRTRLWSHLSRPDRAGARPGDLRAGENARAAERLDLLRALRERLPDDDSPSGPDASLAREGVRARPVAGDAALRYSLLGILRPPAAPLSLRHADRDARARQSRTREGPLPRAAARRRVDETSRPAGARRPHLHGSLQGKETERVSARDAVLAKVRRALGASADDAARSSAVKTRLDQPRPNTIPARGQLDREGRVKLFSEMAEGVAATVERLPSSDDVPAAVARYLRGHNLPLRFRTGSDPAIAALHWEREPHLERLQGASHGLDVVSFSHAFAGVAESGTLILLSGPDNPTTLNFLPETQIVMLSADDLAGDYEAVWSRIRERYGAGVLPRTVNLVTGPSRSADIEQTLILGAHGPRALHILVVG